MNGFIEHLTKARKNENTKKTNDLVNVIYIMGYGHSGSTVLDIILSNHSSIEGVGELKNLHRLGLMPDDSRRCACGEAIHQCPYWGEVRRKWAEKVGYDDLNRYIQLQNRYERFHHCWPRLVLDCRTGSPAWMEFAGKTAALYEAISDVSGKPTVIDSSKDPLRAYALLHNEAVRVHLIHLVRDGRGVVWSMRNPRKKDIAAGIPRDRLSYPAWRTAFGWMVTNLQSEWVLSRGGAQSVHRIRYEELAARPGEVLAELGEVLNEDFTNLSEKIASGLHLPVAHTVSGNRLRMSCAVTLKIDVEWMEKLPAEDRKVFWHLAGWLAGRYGYRRQAR